MSGLDRLRQVGDNATPKPWGGADGGSFGGWWLSLNGDPRNRTLAAVPEGYSGDAEFIATARNVWDALLDIADAAELVAVDASADGSGHPASIADPNVAELAARLDRLNGGHICEFYVCDHCGLNGATST